jgi:hypothetical protein
MTKILDSQKIFSDDKDKNGDLIHLKDCFLIETVFETGKHKYKIPRLDVWMISDYSCFANIYKDLNQDNKHIPMFKFEIQENFCKTNKFFKFKKPYIEYSMYMLGNVGVLFQYCNNLNLNYDNVYFDKDKELVNLEYEYFDSCNKISPIGDPRCSFCSNYKQFLLKKENLLFFKAYPLLIKSLGIRSTNKKTLYSSLEGYDALTFDIKRFDKEPSLAIRPSFRKANHGPLVFDFCRQNLKPSQILPIVIQNIENLKPDLKRYKPINFDVEKIKNSMLDLRIK